MTKKEFKEYTFIALLFILIMEYELFLIRTFLFDRIIKIFAFTLLCLYPSYKTDIYIKKIILLWFGLFLVVLLTNLIHINGAIISQFVKMLFMFSIFLLIVYKVRPFDFTDKIIKFPIFLGVLLSLQGIILFVLVLLGIQPSYEFINNERISAEGRAYNIFWGSMFYTIDGGFFGFTRAIGHFLTPSRMATFLHYPFFVGLGYYLITKKWKYLVSVILSGACIFVTFSYAAYSGVIASSLIGLITYMLHRNRYIKKANMLTGFAVLFLVAFMLYGFMAFVKNQYIVADTSFAEMIFRGGEEGATFEVIKGEEKGLFLYTDSIKEYPLGRGLEMEEGGRPQFAPLYWAEIAGLPGLIYISVILGYFYIRYAFTALIFEMTTIQPYVGLCFIAQTINQVGEGTWLITPYLFTMAMLVLLKKYDFRTTQTI